LHFTCGSMVSSANNHPTIMKGVILAGGMATRLHPLTLVTNKHLLPVYNKPVIYYAIEKLVSAGVDRIMIVTSPHHVNDFVSLLGSGQNFISKKTGKQIQIVYGIQNKASGIADGLYIAKDYIGNENCILYLGDNILEDDISKQVKEFKSGASVFLKEVHDPQRFGVAEVDKNGKILNIEEKPQNPKSNLAVVGVYIYDNTVFKKMIGQKPSARGEFEITYVNQKYIKEKKMKAVFLKKKWIDIGTFNSLVEASNYMKEKHEKNNG
jgi:glucose-1-phosphate thymidylyltransferase